MPQKKKKLSLEEFRTQLGITNTSNNSKFKKNDVANKNFKNKPKNSTKLTKSQIKIKISQLERRIMEGNLNPEEEKTILAEIEELEKRK